LLLKEITVFRTLTVTALFALGLTTAAQADPAPAMDAPSLNSRIARAAENVCAPLLDSRHTSLLYKQWFTDCVTDSTAKITARVEALRPTSTALLPANTDRR
jgi:hypothetical protein